VLWRAFSKPAQMLKKLASATMAAFGSIVYSRIQPSSDTERTMLSDGSESCRARAPLSSQHNGAPRRRACTLRTSAAQRAATRRGGGRA
jgi:hypothetical protein